MQLRKGTFKAKENIVSIIRKHLLLGALVLVAVALAMVVLEPALVLKYLGFGAVVAVATVVSGAMGWYTHKIAHRNIGNPLGGWNIAYGAIAPVAVFLAISVLLGYRGQQELSDLGRPQIVWAICGALITVMGYLLYRDSPDRG